MPLIPPQDRAWLTAQICGNLEILRRMNNNIPLNLQDIRDTITQRARAVKGNRSGDTPVTQLEEAMMIESSFNAYRGAIRE